MFKFDYNLHWIFLIAEICSNFYRKLRSIGTDLSRHKSAKSASSSGYPSPGLDESRCPCGSSVEVGRMIQVFSQYMFSGLFP